MMRSTLCFVTVLLLLVVFKIVSPALTFKGSVCDPGTLPGRFVSGQFPSWKIFNKSCALADLFTPLLATDKSKWSLGVHNIDRRQQENVKILLFGDSVEQHLLADVCAHFVEDAKNILSVKDSHAKRCGKHEWECGACSAPGFILAREPSHGVLSQYGFERSKLSLVKRIPKVISVLTGLYNTLSLMHIA